MKLNVCYVQVFPISSPAAVLVPSNPNVSVDTEVTVYVLNTQSISRSRFPHEEEFQHQSPGLKCKLHINGT